MNQLQNNLYDVYVMIQGKPIKWYQDSTIEQACRVIKIDKYSIGGTYWIEAKKSDNAK